MTGKDALVKVPNRLPIVTMIVNAKMHLEDFSISFKQTEIIERQAYHWLSSRRNSIKKKMPGSNTLE